MTVTLPSPQAVRDVLSDLFGRKVTVEPGTSQELTPDRRSHAAVYRRDDGRVAAVCIWDLAASAAAAGALGGLSEVAVARALESGELSGDMLEFLHEVANIVARLLNAPPAEHSVLAALHPVPGPVPRDVADVVRAPGARADQQVQMEGLPSGLITWLTPQLS